MRDHRRKRTAATFWPPWPPMPNGPKPKVSVRGHLYRARPNLQERCNRDCKIERASYIINRSTMERRWSDVSLSYAADGGSHEHGLQNWGRASLSCRL